jgi:hypothetical protein
MMMECLSDECQAYQKLNADGTCEYCPPQWVVSDCGKYCINPVNKEQDLTLPNKPDPPMYTRTSYSADTLKCNHL